jgi:hypothetical protein
MAVGQIAKLVAALIAGPGNLIDGMLATKLEALGEDFLRKQLSGSFGALSGMPKFHASSEFNQLRDAWFKLGHGNAGKHGDFIEKLFSTMEKAGSDKAPGGANRRKRARWTKTEWARSRQDWLDNKWKHDWRTQPRSVVTGRWLPGRLDNVAATLRYQGTTVGRRTLRRRKQRRKAKLSGRRAARKLFKSLKR